MKKKFSFFLLISSLLFTVFFTKKSVKSELVESQVTVVKKDIHHTVLASGNLSLENQVNIGAQVNGQVKAVHVKVGHEVKKGDLLIEIDPILQQNELKKLSANLTSTDEQILLKKMSIDNFQKIFERQRKLYEIDGISLTDLESAKMDLLTAKQELKILEAQKKQVLVDVDSAHANVSYTRITAPMDGVILQIFANTGQTIVSAQSSPTLIIMGDMRKMVVKAKISEADIAKVHVGQQVWFTVPAKPNKKYEAKIELIETLSNNIMGLSNSDATSSSDGEAVFYHGIFNINNNDNELLPAMNAQVRIITDRVSNALVVPMKAIGKQVGDNSYLVNLKDKGSQIISTGIISDDEVEVVDGLSSGDVLIVDANNE